MQEITLSSGVRLQVNAVPPFVIKEKQELIEAHRPKVPKVHIKEDDRDIEVPENPDYQAALKVFEAEMAEAVYDIVIILGTKAVFIPEDVQKPEDTEWSENLTFLGISVAAEGRGRYRDWMKKYVCRETGDFGLLLSAINKVVGVTEEEAAKAAELFRHP